MYTFKDWETNNIIMLFHNYTAYMHRYEWDIVINYAIMEFELEHHMHIFHQLKYAYWQVNNSKRIF